MVMKNCGGSVEINHKPNQLYIFDHPYRISINCGSGSRKTSLLLNLIKYQQRGIDKTYLYAKDPVVSIPKYQLLINRREEARIKQLKNPKAFIDYSKAVDDVYENSEDYNLTKKRKALTALDYMITDKEAATSKRIDYSPLGGELKKL